MQTDARRLWRQPTIPYIADKTAALNYSRTKKMSEFSIDELAHLRPKPGYRKSSSSTPCERRSIASETSGLQRSQTCRWPRRSWMRWMRTRPQSRSIEAREHGLQFFDARACIRRPALRPAFQGQFLRRTRHKGSTMSPAAGALGLAARSVRGRRGSSSPVARMNVSSTYFRETRRAVAAGDQAVTTSSPDV